MILLIELKNVSKKYNDKYIIKNLNLKINKGEICVFIGPSGCGKSTILKMINKMIPMTDGDIIVDGKSIKDADENELRMNIGYVIQQIGLLPHRTVEQNIAIVPRLFKWDEEKIDKRTDFLLEVVGLNPEEYRKKYPKYLSGGQMQRVGVARALAAEPPIMLMDEPFGAVDPINRKEIQDKFLDIQNEFRKTICFVTHDIDEALKMGDKIAIFRDGDLVQYDEPKNILLYPENEFVEDFIGSNRINKALQFIKVKDIYKDHYISEYSGMIESYVSLDDNLESILNGMLADNEEYVGIKDGDDVLGAISFNDIRKYTNSLEGEDSHGYTSN